MKKYDDLWLKKQIQDGVLPLDFIKLLEGLRNSGEITQEMYEDLL